MKIKNLGKTSHENTNVIWFNVSDSDVDESLDWGIDESLEVNTLQCDGSACDCVDSQSVALYNEIAELVAREVEALGGTDKIEWV